MTDDRMALLEQIQQSTDGDFLRAIAEHTLHRLMAFEVDGLIGATRHERNDERTTYRNGSRPRQLDTRLGTLDLKIPKLRQGSYFPAFLEPRKTAEKALSAVIKASLDPGRLDAQGRRPSSGARHDGDLQEPGLGLMPGSEPTAPAGIGPKGH